MVQLIILIFLLLLFKTGMTMRKIELIKTLFSHNFLKFGTFKLKSGLNSPFYVNLRCIMSYPDIILELSELLYDKINECGDNYYICGLPYAGLPYSMTISAIHSTPHLLLRKEVKTYGCGNMIEGIREGNEMSNVILIDDVLTSGTSITESLNKFKNSGLKIKKIIVLIDREQGGKETLESLGYEVESVFKITEILNILLDEKLSLGINAENCKKIITSLGIR